MREQLDLFNRIAELTRPSFHNSVPIHGQELKQANDKANDQDAYVLSVFQQTGRDFNAWEMYQEVQRRGRTILEKSIRRAMTNLVTAGNLERTKEMRPGQWGAGNSVYKLITK